MINQSRNKKGGKNKMEDNEDNQDYDDSADVDFLGTADDLEFYL